MQKLVWVNGTFDIVHVGHVEMLEYAKSLGDYLVVGIDRDDRVKARKGLGRPVNPDWARMAVLKSLKPVDKVVTFDSDEALTEWIKIFKPDVMVVGEEYRDQRVIGSEWASEVVYFKKVEGFSTTQILGKNNPIE